MTAPGSEIKARQATRASLPYTSRRADRAYAQASRPAH
jgi:hypothetical protein